LASAEAGVNELRRRINGTDDFEIMVDRFLKEIGSRITTKRSFPRESRQLLLQLLLLLFTASTSTSASTGVESCACRFQVAATAD